MRKATVKEKATKNKFLDTLPVQKYDNRPLFTIYIIGLPGVGKSEIAKRVAEKLNIYTFTTDKVRRFLNNNGYVGNNPDQGMVEYISGRATRYLLNNGISYIMDGDAIRFVKNLRRKSKSANAKFILIRVTCSEKETLNRIKLRQESDDNENHSKANEKTYFVRKKLHEKIPKKIFYNFDSEDDIEPQLDEFVSLLNVELKK